MSIAVSIVLLLLVLFAYLRFLRHREERILLFLRLTVLVLFGLLLTGPTVRLTWQEHSRQVAVLVDCSRSMELVGADSQAQALAGRIGALMPHGLKPRFWSFGDSLYPGIDVRRTCEQTRLGRALELALRSRPAAVVLLSDGQDHGELNPVPVVAQAGVPVYAVGFGQNAGANLGVRNLELPALAYAGDTVRVRAVLTSSGLPSNLPVRVIIAGQEQTVRAGGQFSEQEVELPVVLSRPGSVTVEVRVESLPGEITYLDNRASATVQVLPAKFRVVYLSQRPGLNTRFILEELRRNPRISVEPVVSFTGRLNLSAVPAADLYILDGVSESPSDREAWLGLEQRVRSGAGLLFIAEPDTAVFGPVLDRLLPLGGWSMVRGSFTPVPTAAAGIAGIFDPAGFDFNQLPPFSVLVTGVPAAGAVVWLQAGETGAPVMSAGRAGRGRVIYFGGYPLWRWGFLPGPGLGRQTPLAVFLERVSNYLTEPDTGRFILEPERQDYLTGEPVRFRLRARRPSGEGWEGLDVMLGFEHDGSRVPMVEQGGGVYQAVVSGLAPGRHKVVAEIRQEGVVVGRALTELTVAVQSVEAVRLGLNRGLLERLAEAGNGRFVLAESVGPELFQELRPRRYERRLVVDPRTRLWWFGLLAVVFGVELILRRRKGLD